MNSGSYAHMPSTRVQKRSNPALFGVSHPRKCMCEVPGQVPCPGLVPLPKELRGKYRDLKADSLKPPRGVRPDP